MPIGGETLHVSETFRNDPLHIVGGEWNPKSHADIARGVKDEGKKRDGGVPDSRRALTGLRWPIGERLD
jgi:hypothetical protein